MNPTAPSNQKATPITAKIIWGALSFSILMYGIVLQTLPSQSPGPATTIIKQVMAVQALALGFVSLFLRSWAMSPPAIRKRLVKKGFALDSLAEPEKQNQAYEELLTTWFQFNILSWALNEAIAISGFLVAMISRDATSYIPFALAALVLNVLTFPREKTLKDRIETIARNPIAP